jgi:hypothetical protein
MCCPVSVGCPLWREVCQSGSESLYGWQSVKVTCGLRRVDFAGLRTSDARIVSTHSSLTPGLPLLLRSWTLGNAVASLLLHSHSEVAYWTVCGHFVRSGWQIFCLKNHATQSARSCSHHFTNNWLRNVKMAAYSNCRFQKKLPEFGCNLPQTQCG